MRFNSINDFIASKINDAINHTVDFLNENSIDRNNIKVVVEQNNNIEFGDFSTKFVMSLGLSGDKCFEYATDLATTFTNKKYFKEVTVTKPGFINFKLSDYLLHQILFDIIKKTNKFGIAKKTKLKYNIEFVSANPTGSLHIGHARNAAIGDTLARIWEANGIRVDREYYINDAGNQMELLAVSVLIRYKQLFGEKVELPEDSYHGDEIIAVANKLKEEYGDQLLHVQYNEKGISLAYAKEKQAIKLFAENFLLTIIKNTLEKFGVKFDIWFPETELYKNDSIKIVLELLRDHIYSKDGAVWLKTTEYGDDKDRVLVKSDGNNTYFMPDIAYHNIKLSRGYDKVINIWGADHKSYADRMSIAIQLLGYKKEQLTTLIMQMVRLTKNGKEFKMSKRSGSSLTLEDLINTIGKEPARWYLVSKPISSHLEIDVAKATQNDRNNPLYYIQYAHARIQHILCRKVFKLPNNFNLLTSKIERQIIVVLHSYVSTLKKIAYSCEVNILTVYLYNLAKLFHSYYASNKIIDESNIELSEQRYWFVFCIKTILANGLALLDIKPANEM